MKSSARMFFVFFLFSIFYFLFSVPIFAQTSSSVNSYAIPNVNPDVPQNTHTLSQTVLIDVMSAVICQLAGVDIVNKNQECLGIDQNTGKIGFVKNGGGLIGLTTSGIAMLYNPPIHGTEYFDYLAQNFGISKPAYAQQGYGFSGISPLRDLWLAFTKIVYLIFIAVFIIIGIAIMLRIKIDPRTVMTIENQIPKIIIGLLLVTFSFAIAGFLIDIMWVAMYIVLNVLGSATPDAAKAAASATSQLNDPPIRFVNGSFGFFNIVIKTSLDLGDIIRNLFSPQRLDEIFHLPAGQQDCSWFDISCQVGRVTGGAMLTFLSQIVGWFTSIIVSIAAFVIISIALLSALIRLWFRLIFAYIVTLLDVIMGPFFIISGVIPGGPGVSAWLRDLVGNLATFPTVLVMFVIGKILMDAFSQQPGRLFTPPFIGDPNGKSLGSLIGLGFILMTPSMMDKVKNAIKAPKIDLSAIGQAIGVGAGAVNLPSHLQKLGQFGYYRKYYWSEANPFKWFSRKPTAGETPPAH